MANAPRETATGHVAEPDVNSRRRGVLRGAKAPTLFPVTGTYDRRTFLRRAGLAGVSGAVLATGARRPAAATDDDLAPFFHGVASGDPTASSVILWTRVTPTTTAPARIPVQWEIATDPDFADVAVSGIATAVAGNDHTIKVAPGGLEPFRYYWYRFHALGATSITGRTKTAPAPGQEVDRLRFGLVSCSNYEGGYFNAYARLAERNDMDAILCAGDYIYEYGQGSYGPGEGIGRVVQPPLEMTTLADYRARFAHYRLDPDLRRLHQLYPWINTWDDHETTNDSWSGGAENHNPDGDFTGEDDNRDAETGLDWEVRKRDAWKAYREWLPVDIDATSLDEPIELYRALAYGNLADIVVMDTRIEGRDEQVFEVLEPGVTETEINNPDRRMISPTQQAFVQNALSCSQACWKVILQQVMLMQWRIPSLPEGLAGQPDIPLVLLTPGGNTVNGDAWDGYTAERDRLFSFLRAKDITDVVVLTGDIHTTWAAELTDHPNDLGPGGYDVTGLIGPPVYPRNLGVEFVCPSVTSDNLDEILSDAGMPAALIPVAIESIETGTLTLNPHIKSVELAGHGYSILDVTPERTVFDSFFVDRSQPSDAETFHESWQTPKSGPGETGHRLIQRSAPVQSRTEVPAPPSALPVVARRVRRILRGSALSQL